MEDISANSAAELTKALRAIDISLPPRTEGRTAEDCERWSICRFLSTLNGTANVNFPVRVAKRERPDFQVCSGGRTWGVEVTEAIPTDYARASALLKRESADALPDISLFKYGDTKTLEEIRSILAQKELTGDGWAGDSAERELADALRSVTESKTVKLRKREFEKYSRNLLLVYDNMPLPHLDHDAVAVRCAERLIDYWAGELTFDEVVVESGNTMFFFGPSQVRKVEIVDLWDDA